MGYQAVHEALESRGLIGSGGLGHIKCPAHDDARGSLSLKEGSDDKALVYCHAGCPAKEVVEALDLTEGDLFAASQGGFVVDQYVYENYAGEPIYRVTRLEPKGFYQERFEEGEWKPGMRDVPRYPYRLTDWKDATWVYITEGEKDADRLNDLGVPATTLVGGAGKWRDEYATWFADKTVTIIADNDEPGILGAQRIALGLNGTNGVTTTIKLPREGKDVSDHLDAGFDAGDFILFEQGLEDLEPLDWETYIGEDIRWLYKPYIPADGRVLAFGAAGSLKSLWAMWVAGRLSKEGKKVAYFSLEMRPSDTVRRIKQLHPNRENFKLFTKFNFRNPNQVMLVIDKLKGYDLIVIDSWTASHKGGNDNEEVAQLDTEVFQPIIDGTGASLLILDNTGHSTYSEDGEHKQDHARGASAKGDKMEVTLWFDRPIKGDNYRTRISVMKMRLDHPIPEPMVVVTPRDRIEFFKSEHVNGQVTIESQSAWPTSNEVLVDTLEETTVPDADSDGLQLETPELTLPEKLALARLKDALGATELPDEE